MPLVGSGRVLPSRPGQAGQVNDPLAPLCQACASEFAVLFDLTQSTFHASGYRTWVDSTACQLCTFIQLCILEQDKGERYGRCGAFSVSFDRLESGLLRLNLAGSPVCWIWQGTRDPEAEEDVQIDFARLRKWYTLCTGQHDGCIPTQESSVVAPNSALRPTVIDVIDQCLLTLPAGRNFIALSYVWGQTATFQSSLATYEKLRTKGGLRGISERLPRTLRDAMKVVRELGERYLWIDSLCIVQDDYDERDTNIEHMQKIYGAASFTIVAADGDDADYGLPGVSTRPREPWHKLESFGTVYYFEALARHTARPTTLCGPFRPLTKELKHYASLTPWSKRAWTFQELLLSSRLLVFHKQEVLWHCRQGSWCEAFHYRAVDESGLSVGFDQALGNLQCHPHYIASLRGTDLNLQINRDGNLVVMRSEAFSLYAWAVAAYTARTLGVNADVLNAFFGIQDVLSQCFQCLLMQGMPEELLDSALLWRRNPSQILVRRQGYFPSWSWTGWVGPVHYPDTFGVHDGQRRPILDLESPVERIQPLVRYHVRERGVKGVRKIETLLELHVQLQIGPHEYLPRWCDTETAADETAEIRSAQASVATAAAALKAVKPADTRLSHLVFWSSVASFHTKLSLWSKDLTESTAFDDLHVDPARPDEAAQQDHLIWSFDTQIIGEVVYDERQDLAGQVDLVVLSEAQFFVNESLNRGDAYLNDMNQGSQPLPNLYRQPRAYELYNVLAVEFSQSRTCAWRIGIGKVYKSAWHKVVTKQMWIVLG